MMPHVEWPGGHRFAFTIFDDPDAQTPEASRAIYGFLEDIGLRTTKAVWVLEPQERNSPGETCESLDWRRHCVDLQRRGFEIAYHNGAPGSLQRPAIIRSLDLFREYFGHDPVSMANHYNEDAIYWGRARLSGMPRLLYSALTFKSNFFGHVDGHASFWGDLCRQRIQFCRNFVFRDINTLKACPQMPYVDPERPYVNAWYSASEGANRDSFVRQLAEAQQDRLEQEGGACVMYTHFGHGFVQDGRVDPHVRRLLTRLAAKGGWFVPVSDLLEYLRARRGEHVLTAVERGRLERTWLASKVIHGTS
jgi:hypothetical protein